MVTLSMRLSADQPNKDRFVDTVRGMLGPIRVEPGCLDCRLCEDVEDDCGLLLLQEWRDEPALSRHIRGNTFRSLLMALDLLSMPPLISVTRAQHHPVLTNISDLYEST